MPTLRIDCVDSGTLGLSSTTSPGGQPITMYGISRSEPTVYARRATNGFTSYELFYSFNNIDLGFLDTATINSMTINVYCRAVYTNANFDLKSAPYRLSTSQNTFASDYISSMSGFAVNGSNISNTWWSANIPSLADLKRCIQNGVGTGSRNYPAQIGFDGVAGENPPYIIVDYVDNNTPPRTRAISPNGDVIESNLVNRFIWEYSQAVNSPQSHVDIQYYDGSWKNVLSHASLSVQYYDVPANTLNIQTTQWRIRVYTQSSIVSEWSSAQIIVRAAPITPNITNAPNNPHPLFTWQSDSQTGYELQILDINDNILHTSGEVFSQTSSYQYPGYLSDGVYSIRVRVINQFDIWSDWGVAGFSVSNSSTYQITLYSKATCKNTISLIWSTTNTFSNFYVLRNGEPIARLGNTINSYEDFNSNGKNTYTVRGINNPYYTDSNTATETICIKNAQITPYGSSSMVKLLRRRGARPLHTEVESVSVSYQSYEGRELPVVYRSIPKSIIHEYEFSISEKENFDYLMSLNNTLVVYKDCKGHLVIGNLEIRNIDHNISLDVQFTITEVYTGEIINYA